MSDDTTTQKKKPGRKPSEGAENGHQFLAVRNAEVIKSIKVAAEADITTSEMLESAARASRSMQDVPRPQSMTGAWTCPSVTSSSSTTPLQRSRPPAARQASRPR